MEKKRIVFKIKMYKPTIGLEIHIELNTKSKMFCSCLNNPDEKKPNTNVCPVCMAHPGVLPVINEEAIKKTIKTGLALNCSIPENSKFDRKNYFYPDLPKGYQISQYDQPLCINGYIEVEGKKVRIRRVHLEEDTGKLIHVVEEAGTNRLTSGDREELKTPEGTERLMEKYEQKGYSLIDFNRAGVPLMELVTEPDICSAKEAREFAQELHLIMHYLGVSDADMEKGQMRVEVNISLQDPGWEYKEGNSSFVSPGSGLWLFSGKSSEKPPTMNSRVEIKNINSFRSVEKAIEYEIVRQTEALEKGEKIIQETRGWNDARGTTVSQREKEEAHDYRYFPEPDLPPLKNSAEFVEEIRSEIQELPQQKIKRMKEDYSLDKEKVEFLVYNKSLGEYFEKVVSEFNKGASKEEVLHLGELTANYLLTDLQGLLGGSSVSSEDFLITAQKFADFIVLIRKGEISSKIAKMVLAEMYKTGGDPSNIIKEKRLAQITDEGEIEKAVKEVIDSNPKVVEEFKNGKSNSLQFLVGQVMAKTKGKANPQLVNNLLNKLLTK